ncbi:hypothetical protein [Brachyspira hyodysenteriae]|uniref:hypothetical protein n=1 Tax=Brachyspira hyodysenteriae TaxID=159 RepID=UPI0022CD44F8|nr:hypothetical protein [Brachyspira hyodysenteriae]MCZ9938827.1 hypothetical protein [Brachyspira hyodysenteriae]MCZ9961369.1 hypothetical protein [Brachyspira hyodysenteriae]
MTEEDKSMIEGYLDKVDASSEDLTDEEKELYQSYLSNAEAEESENKEESSELIEETEIKAKEISEPIEETKE